MPSAATENRPDRGQPRIPADAYVIIIGAMKCGTSSLYGQLIQSPQVCGCSRKEPEFFSRRDRAPTLADYERLWDYDPGRHRVVLEGSTGYTKHPTSEPVPERIQASGIRPKFIYLVRNPFERIVSHYFHNRANEDLKGGLSGQLEFYINVSNYYQQLRQYERHFPKESLLVLDFEEYKSSPEAVVSRCCRFIGIDDSFYAQYVPDGTQNKTYYYSKAQIRIDDNPLLSALSRALPRGIKALLKKRLIKPGAAAEVLSPQDRATIHDRLQGDMASLATHYGIDVGRWGFDQPGD